jgi:hypothetical protein
MSLMSFVQNFLSMLQTALPIIGALALVLGGLAIALHMASFRLVGGMLLGLIIAFAAVTFVQTLFV